MCAVRVPGDVEEASVRAAARPAIHPGERA